MADSKDVITLRLAQARNALHDLLTGTKIVSLTRAGPAGDSRSVTYSQTNISDLRTYIVELETQLGQSSGRRRPAGVIA